MSADQRPDEPSLIRGFSVEFQPLNVPATDAEVAFGAQTRNVTPVPAGLAYGIEPMPGLLDCAKPNAMLHAKNSASGREPDGRRENFWLSCTHVECVKASALYQR